MNEHEERIVGRLEAVDEASAPEIAEFLGVSRQSAFRYLSALVERGVVVRRGAGRATRYALVEELRQTIAGDAAHAGHRTGPTISLDAQN